MPRMEFFFLLSVHTKENKIKSPNEATLTLLFLIGDFIHCNRPYADWLVESSVPDLSGRSNDEL